MVRIGVVSDTHADLLRQVPAPVMKALSEVDVIVHAGDFTEMAVLEGLRALAEVKAVAGNMDSAEIKRMLPREDSFVIEGRRFGLTHGSGPSWGLAHRVRNMFENVDVIIYGHSHEAASEHIEGILLFNPGRARNSFGIMTIDDRIETEIVTI